MKFRPLRVWMLAAPTLVYATGVCAQDATAVQPGGDIPANFKSAQTPAIPPGGDVPARFKAPRGPFEYVRRQVEIPMRDGVKLHTVLVIPRNVRGAPIMLDRTPYSAEGATSRGSFGPTPENILGTLNAELIRAGYIVAIQDVRGKYGSGGEYVMNRPLAGPLNSTGIDHSTDAWDTIDWLVKNVAESNGRVGTFGTSYDGFTALMSLIKPHPALKASVPINPMVDVWKGDDWFHNGAFRQEMISYVYGQTASKKSDEKWFSTGQDDYETFLKHGSAEGYGAAMGMDQLPFWRRLVEHPAYDAYWQGQAVDMALGAQGLTVPTLLIDSLWDQEDIYGAPAVYAATRSSPNAHLVLGPWHHGQSGGVATEYGPLDLGSDTARWFRLNVMIPFLDENLKGAGKANLPKVMAFEAGTNRWERLEDWPSACSAQCPTSLTPLYLKQGNSLGFTADQTASRTTYVSDPAKPVVYRARPNLSPWAPGSSWRTWLGDDQRFADGRPDVLTYVGPVTDRPIRLSGNPKIHLIASTSGTDSDWVVKLIDVFPPVMADKPELAGYQFPIAMDIFRGRYREDPARAKALTPNVPLAYDFPLPTVSYVLQPGHRLMVQVQSSWFPLYDRNPQTFVPNIFRAQAKDYRAATQAIYSGPEGSWIGLPIIP